MKIAFLAGAAALALSACNGMVLKSPSDVGVSSALQEKVEQFCAADFADGNLAALNEWIGLYNTVAPLIDREPIDATALTQNAKVQTLFAVRSVLCMATEAAPAPAVVEAVAAAE